MFAYCGKVGQELQLPKSTFTFSPSTMEIFLLHFEPKRSYYSGPEEVDFKVSRVGGNIDQGEALSLGPRSFGIKLMDRDDLEVYILKNSTMGSKIFNFAHLKLKLLT